MKVAMVSVATAFSSFGFRKVAAAAREVVPDLQAFYVMLRNSYSPLMLLFASKETENTKASEADLRSIAETLCQYDVIAFSTYTDDAPLTHEIIREIRAINPDRFIVWGGVHPILAPEDAMEVSDAICIGEGIPVFLQLLQRLKKGEPYHDIRNFWFRTPDGIIKNGLQPLLTNQEMEELPHPLYGEAEHIFDPGKGFRPVTDKDYRRFNGLSYNTLWTQGCPFRCTYCGNSRFLEMDRQYGKLRYPSVDYFIEEVRRALKKHPFISTVTLNDDSFMAMPEEMLAEFSVKWRQRVDIPFATGGVTPFYVTREKFELLLEAGLNRVRMGIQSGSERILKFFKRPHRPGVVLESARVIGGYPGHMIPPAYDFILDVPVETREDLQATLQLLRDLPRPYTLNVFSLRVIPNTELARQLDEQNLVTSSVESGFFSVAPTLANALVYLSSVIRLPQGLLDRLAPHLRPASEPGPTYPVLLFVCRMLSLVKRGFSHVRFMDFSLIPGPMGWWLWGLGILQFWRQHLVRPFRRETDSKLPACSSHLF